MEWITLSDYKRRKLWYSVQSAFILLLLLLFLLLSEVIFPLLWHSRTLQQSSIISPRGGNGCKTKKITANVMTCMLLQGHAVFFLYLPLSSLKVVKIIFLHTAWLHHIYTTSSSLLTLHSGITSFCFTATSFKIMFIWCFLLAYSLLVWPVLWLSNHRHVTNWTQLMGKSKSIYLNGETLSYYNVF